MNDIAIENPRDPSAPNPNKLTTKQVANRLGKSVSTLKKWRMENFGPAYSKWGRKVVYDIKDVIAFEDQKADVG